MTAAPGRGRRRSARARARSARLAVLAAAVLLALAPPSARGQRLGPTDGRDLPATDLERVSLGTAAPGFALESYDRGVVDLASFRGAKNVVLVFYRGHW